VANWLVSKGLGEYVEIFSANGLDDFFVLPFVSKELLRNLRSFVNEKDIYLASWPQSLFQPPRERKGVCTPV
jgi:SAM (Sterile alpha motif) domain-containing protein